MTPRSGSRPLTTRRGTISTVLDRPSGNPKGVVFLAHGAGGTLRHPLTEALAGALRDRSFAVLRFNFPYAESGRRRPDPEAVLIETWLEVWEHAIPESAFPGVPRLAAGRSLGGRMASLAIAGHPARQRPAGLVLFAYPLHPPGRPEKLRAGHLASVSVPMLFVSGTRDEFATGDRLERAVAGLGGAEVHRLPGADHSFRVGKRSGSGEADMLTLAMDAVDAWYDRVVRKRLRFPEAGSRGGRVRS